MKYVKQIYWKNVALFMALVTTTATTFYIAYVIIIEPFITLKERGLSWFGVIIMAFTIMISVTLIDYFFGEDEKWQPKRK